MVTKQKLHVHRKRQFRQLDKPEADPAVSNSTIINLHSSTLFEAEEKLLSKGLNFCPTPTEVNQVDVSQNLTEYYRRLRLRKFYLDLPPTDPEPFRCKSTWVPPNIMSPLLKPTSRLVPKLINLITLSIGLTNRTNYETLDSDPTGNFCKEIQETLDDSNHLSKKVNKFLSPTDCGTARFYLLLKVHKPGNPERPINLATVLPLNIFLFSLTVS